MNSIGIELRPTASQRLRLNIALHGMASLFKFHSHSLDLDHKYPEIMRILFVQTWVLGVNWL